MKIRDEIFHLQEVLQKYIYSKNISDVLNILIFHIDLQQTGQDFFNTLYISEHWRK